MLASDLVYLECTLPRHGALELQEEVLAQTQAPAVTDLIDTMCVLVDKTIDLGDLVVNLDPVCGEKCPDIRVGGETLLLLHMDIRQTSDGLEKIADGGKSLTVALSDSVNDAIFSSNCVCLEGHVIVRDLAVLALDSLGDLQEQGLLSATQVFARTLCHSLHFGLTLLDGNDDSLLHVCLHGC